MDARNRPLAVVTGASSGIGFELAVQCARHGFDLVVAADRPLDDAVGTLRAYRAGVEAVQADLSTVEGVDRLLAAIGERPVEALLANAGQGVGSAFLDREFDELRRVIDTNVTGTLYLLHAVLRRMRARGRGRVLVTGSIAGYMPGSFHAVYNASKAFIDSFAWALRDELEGSGVTVTCLMPGATDTEFFEHAGLLDTRLAQQKKDDPAMVARLGFEAMMAGEGGVVTGLRNKLQVAAARVTPAPALAALHGTLARPGSADQNA
ncbi:MAG: SDR family NAD(P)-dependent oxidoreductase [Steroidobacteraceae bacterium]|jgi:short-subunit dehydrogenase|nr:SDR family NAD(P)-dependent oxidoreductase [Steroidobacteraceae bacterium]